MNAKNDVLENNFYQEIEIVCCKGYPVKVDAGYNCQGYSGYATGTRIVSPNCQHGTVKGVNQGEMIYRHGYYEPARMSVWMILDRDHGLASYAPLGNSNHELYTLPELGYITEEEFNAKVENLQAQREHRLQNGWIETELKDGKKILINANRDDCLSLRCAPGKIEQYRFGNIKHVGVAPGTQGIFGPDVIWVEYNNRIITWNEANTALKYETIYSIFLRPNYEQEK